MRKNFKKMVIPPALCICLFGQFNLVMAEDSKEVTLEAVEVHSTVLKDYQVTTEVITAEKIKEMGATNLAEALESVPGLYMARADKAARLVRIRGAATDQTKVYIDGMPVFPLSGIASNSASDLATVPVENIEKIEIIKGPGPVQYGTDYKGGVILITTKNGKGPGQFNLNLSGGSHKSFDNYISYSGSDNKASYYITAGKKQGDGHLNHSEFDTEYFNGKIKWDLGKESKLTLSGYYMTTDREIPNGIDQITGQETTTDINWSGDKGVWTGKYDDKGKKIMKYAAKDWKYSDFKQTNIALQFEEKASNKFKYDIKVYHVTDANDLSVYNVTNANLGLNTSTNPLRYNSEWTSKGNGIEFTGDFQTDRNNTLTFGAKYNKIDWDSNDVLNKYDSGSDKRTGYYLQDSWRLGDKTDLTMGVRHDQVQQSFRNYEDKDEDTTDPVFNITHRLDENNTLRFSAGKTHNFVTAKQVTGNIKAGAAIPDPEKAKNYELGWKHNFDEKSSLDVAIFNNKIDNRIDKITDKSNPLYNTFRNIFKTDIQGAELEYSRYFTKRLKGFVNYTYLDAKDTNEAGVKSRAANLPENMFNYGLTYTVDKFRASVFGHYLGNVLTTDNTYKKLDSYHTVDLNLSYHENKNVEYYLHVNNLFDTNYWEKYDFPGDGINFMAGINIKM
ncbi:Vitamin B12 transporter BtuB [Sporomusa rhizae]|uniref:TonB-dependent receptor n=1 Tax=Sporomusa rhizae TaxID=357999 RepID=UPI003529DEAD